MSRPPRIVSTKIPKEALPRIISRKFLKKFRLRGQTFMRSHTEPVGELANREYGVTESQATEPGLARAGLHHVNQVIDDYGVEKGGGKHLDQIQALGLSMRLELLRNTLRPMLHVSLPMKEMKIFAKREYVNPVGSIKDRATYWMLKLAAERCEINEETTVIESSSGNFAAAVAAFAKLVGLRFIPVIGPNI